MQLAEKSKEKVQVLFVGSTLLIMTGAIVYNNFSKKKT